MPIGLELLLPNSSSSVTFGFLVALFGKAWYVNSAAHKVRKLFAQSGTREELLARAQRAGGVSTAGAALGTLIMIGGITAMVLSKADQRWAKCTQDSDWAKKIAGCSNIIETGASETTVKRSVAHLNRGVAYQNTGELGKAAQDYNEAIQLDPRNAFAYSNRSSVLVLSDVSKAIADATEALRLDPKLAFAYANRSRAYLRNNDFDSASTDATRALELNPKLPLAHLIRSTARMQARDFEGAISDANEALRLSPESAWALFTRGMAFYGKGDLTRAITDLEAALTADPNFTSARQGLEEVRRSIAKQ